MPNAPNHNRATIEALLSAAAALGEAVPVQPPERLYSAKDRPFGLSSWTFRSWAASGRLKCFRGPRGRLEAWESEVRKAIEAEAYVPRAKKLEAATDLPVEDDPFADDVAAGRLEEGTS
jgi:hypothetical protein